MTDALISSKALLLTENFKNSPPATRVFHRRSGQHFNISFRTLDLPADYSFLHQWVNDPGAKQFWQMDGPLAKLQKAFEANQQQAGYHSFIGCLNDNPVCQADVYHLLEDELALHVNATENDYGIHFLMAPLTGEKIPHLSVCCMQNFLSFLFSFNRTERIFGEPDFQNSRARKLVLKAGFDYLHPVKLSGKTAGLYCCTRDRFKLQPKYVLTALNG